MTNLLQTHKTQIIMAKKLQECVDFLQKNNELFLCEHNLGYSFDKNKNIEGFAHHNETYHDRITPVYHDSNFIRTAGIVFIAQRDTMSPLFAQKMKRYKYVVLYVNDIGRAMHLLGEFIVNPQ